jgi:hypothetical protein
METTEETTGGEAEKNGWKIFFFSLGLLACLSGLFMLSDMKGIGDLWNMHSVRHYVTSILLTTAIILGFCLYRLVFQKSHSDASHRAEHALLGGLHGDLISAVMHADEELKELIKDLAANADRIKKFHRKYLAGLGVISILVWTLIVPIFGLASSWVDNDPHKANPLAIVLYGIAYAGRSCVILYWGMAIATGWRKVHQGHIGVLLLNGHIIGIREFGDGLIFTLPFTGSIELMQVEKEVTIQEELTPSQPMIPTASKFNAVYDSRKTADNTASRRHEERYGDDIFHKNRMLVSKNKLTVIFRMTDVVTFFKEKRNIEEVRERLSEMVKSARNEAFHDKTYAMIPSKIVREIIKQTLTEELDVYDKCFSVKNVEVPEIDYLTDKDHKVSPVTIAA